MEIIVLHDKYTNEPIIIRVSAINVIKKEILILDENKNNREEYTGITVGNIYYGVKEDIGVVMMKIKAVENKYISGKEKNNECFDCLRRKSNSMYRIQEKRT